MRISDWSSDVCSSDLEIAGLSVKSRSFQRLLLGSAQDVEMDGSGRILVAPELRTAAGMTREVMLLGMGSHFELWDVAAWATCEAEDLGKGMTDDLDRSDARSSRERVCQ